MNPELVLEIEAAAKQYLRTGMCFYNADGILALITEMRRLEAENARLREALIDIKLTATEKQDKWNALDDIREIAIAALGGEGETK